VGRQFDVYCTNEDDISALNSNERLQYETSLKEYRDLYSVVKTAKQEGFNEGEIKGKVKGKIEGKIEGAKNLIKLQVLTDQQIADSMELKLEQVKQLKETLDNDGQ
jgi:predicted transposase/invertase (TIGR01784 family)